MDQKRAKELAIIATRIRLAGLDAVHTAASGHIGGSLSVADILAVLYFEKMRVHPPLSTPRSLCAASSPRRI